MQHVIFIAALIYSIGFPVAVAIIASPKLRKIKENAMREASK